MFSTIENCEFYCLCTKNSPAVNGCCICHGSSVINKKNFGKGFYNYVIGLNPKNEKINVNDSIFLMLNMDTMDEKNKDYEQYLELNKFIEYQFRFLTYDKYYKITNENNTSLLIENLIEQIYEKLIPKYIKIFVDGKRSFLTEVAEQDAVLGNYNIILFLMNINNKELSTGEKILEFSDGFKSAMTIINKEDPINKLLNKMILHNWMNVEIGMSKVVNVSPDFEICMKIYYNSLSPVKENIEGINYGPLFEKKLIEKNITELENDGGEISMIKIIIIKKYNYYVHNFTKKTNFSAKKYENESTRYRERDNSDIKESANKNGEEKEPDKIQFNFRLIAMDYEIYNIIKKNLSDKKLLDKLLKKKFIIDVNTKYLDTLENFTEGKMYKLMFLNMEKINKNPETEMSHTATSNNSINSKYNFMFPNDTKSEANIFIKFSDKSQFEEIKLNQNYKSEKQYIETKDLINKSINLTNNIDIGKLFIEDFNKLHNDTDNYINKEFYLSGIFSGVHEKTMIATNLENKENGNKNQEYIKRHIFLSIGDSKVAVVRIHKIEFFDFDVKANKINEKVFNCSNIIYKGIMYFNEENNQPKIVGKKTDENCYPVLSLETTCYTVINLVSVGSNDEQMKSFTKYQEANKNIVEGLKFVVVFIFNNLINFE